jgi:hypothetical protein
MPALYVDTSALVKRYVGEVETLAAAEAQRLGPARAVPLCPPVPPGGDHAGVRGPGQCPCAGPSLAGV